MDDRARRVGRARPFWGARRRCASHFLFCRRRLRSRRSPLPECPSARKSSDSPSAAVSLLVSAVVALTHHRRTQPLAPARGRAGGRARRGARQTRSGEDFSRERAADLRRLVRPDERAGHQRRGAHLEPGAPRRAAARLRRLARAEGREGARSGARSSAQEWRSLSPVARRRLPGAISTPKGRAVGGSVVLRIREVSGDRLELLGLRERHAEAERALEGLRAHARGAADAGLDSRRRGQTRLSSTTPMRRRSRRRIRTTPSRAASSCSTRRRATTPRRRAPKASSGASA